MAPTGNKSLRLRRLATLNIDAYLPTYCFATLSSSVNRTLLLQYVSFTGCTAFICDFHREQAWERWLKKTSNGCILIKDEVLHLLRRIARFGSEGECKQAVDALKKSKIWSNNKYKKLVKYLESYWLNIPHVG